MLRISRVCVCVTRLRYLPCMTHVPYCDIRNARLYNIFFNSHYKRHDFRGEKKKVVENKECVLIFSTTFSDQVLILMRLESNIIKN